MTTRLLATIASAAMTASAFGQLAPPFSEKTELQGSCKFVPDDWETTVVGDGGSVQMIAPGLALKPGSDGNNRAYTQYRRDFNPASGKTAYAKFRIRFDHPDEELTAFGFFSEPPTDDPFDPNPPAVAAYFLTEPLMVGGGQGKLFVVYKSSTWAGPTKVQVLTSTGPFIVNEIGVEAYDFVVEIVGTSRVVFWYKVATDTSWSSLPPVTINIPDAPVRLSAAMKRTSTGSDFPGLVLAVFDLEEAE